jgi:ankyrin repeat protein
LWITGRPGYGKTILTAHIVRHLKCTESSPLAYFFFSADNEDRDDPYIVARSWVYQLSLQSGEAFTIARHERERDFDRPISQNAVMEVLREILLKVPRCVCIVDGIDECASKRGWESLKIRSLLAFWGEILRVVAGTTSRILIVSREDQDIRTSFCDYIPGDGDIDFTEYKISSEDVQADAMLLSQHIVNAKLANKTLDVQKDIAQKMVKRSDSMLLRIRLMEAELRGGKNHKQLERLIDQTPQELNQLYDRSWQRIMDRDNDKHRALSILRWVTFAQRSVTISEITEALLVDNDTCTHALADDMPDEIDEEFSRTEILDLCHSLVEVRANATDQEAGSRTLHLSHSTVREYILHRDLRTGERKTMNSEQQNLNDSIQHNILAETCLRYLQIPSVWDGPEQALTGARLGSFRDYATRFWYQHLRRDCDSYKSIFELLKQFFCLNVTVWENWRKCFDLHGTRKYLQDGEHVVSANPLFYAAYLQCADIVHHMVSDRGFDVNLVDNAGRTACLAAADRGDLDLMRYLLDHNATVSATSNRGWTPLHAASREGHLDMVKLLMERGAAWTSLTEKGATAVGLASFGGHVEIVSHLLNHGSDFHTANNNGWTPLHAASRKGHSDVVKLLIERGAKWAVVTNRGETPLYLASLGGHIDVMKHLLNHGSDCSRAKNDGWTPLHIASQEGQYDVVRLLIAHGASGTMVTDKGATAVYLASSSGHLEIVRHLLHHRADYYTATNNSWTPLHIASQKGHVDVVKLLMERGAVWTTQTEHGLTPLYLASFAGHIEIVKHLINHGAGYYTTENDSGTPHYTAAQKKHLDVVKLLTERGARTTAGTKDSTALFLASLCGHIDVMKHLLDHGSDCSIAKNDGWTPLHIASEKGQYDVVRLLIEHGASGTMVTDKGATAVYLASLGGHIDVVRHLLNHGSDCSIAKNDGWTPLHIASEKGHYNVVRLLIERGAEWAAVNNRGETPLYLASRGGHVKIVRYLLDHGADCCVGSHNGRTPLHAASYNGHLDVATYLLSAGADVETKDCVERSPIFYAAIAGELACVKLLTSVGGIYDLADRYRATVLSFAVRGGSREVVDHLLHLGILDVNIPDCFGRTAIYWARKQNLSQILPRLLSSGGSDTQTCGTSAVRFRFNRHKTPVTWCDVCLSVIEATYFHCPVCSSDNFDICSPCREFGAHCLVDSHELELRGDIAG